MRKQFYSLLASMLALVATGANGQTLLDEGFETSSTESISRPVAEGWTTVDSYKGDYAGYTWHNSYSDSTTPTITGKHVAACDAPTYEADPKGGIGPREEILLTPELDLNDTYELSFTWRVSPMNAMDAYKYDLQVRVVVNDDLNNAETVFSIQDRNMLKESGVLDFPIETWNPRTSTIDLSDWKGEKVKIAFVHKMLTTVANVVWLDDVKVYQHTPATQPTPRLSSDRYTFGDVYVGEKFYTELITLTNVGKNGLTVTGIDLPEGVGTTLEPTSVNLDKNENVRFQFYYKASLTSPANATVVIHTNGGDVSFTLVANKQLVPDGQTLETFEEYFPPAGWKNNGWGGTDIALEGDRSAYASGSYSDQYLTSPRLDLSKGGKLTFTYYNDFTSDEGDSYQSNDISVEVSYDGGNTWQQKWLFDYTLMEYTETLTIDLGTGTDNSYVRWHNTAVGYDDEGAYEFSSFYLDRVLLPNVYGLDGVPGAATLVKPANNATNVYPKNVELEWAPAPFATGYRLFVGSDAEATNLINGIDVGNTLTYTLASTPYETTINWKVVAYNAKGDATDVPVWKFTTQPDATVMTFPYEENFDECTGKEAPAGWLSTTTITDLYPTWTNRRWEPLATDKAYGGKGSSMYTMWLYGGYSSTLTSPEFNLPANGENMNISFVWGDNHPVDLIVDETGLLKKENVAGGNGYSDVVFEIFADGQWKQAAYLSENYNEDGDTKYWRKETVDLSDYAGKTVMFRWVNNAYTTAHRGAGLDNIVIDGIVGSKAVFNKTGWNAGKVNYEKAVNSGNQFTLINEGSDVLKVKSVSFKTDNFESSITPGTEIAADGGITFNVQFNAKQTNDTVSDEMTVEFESGYTMTFPVEGVALPENVLYYSFEPNELDYEWKTDFTQIDVDKKNTYDPTGYYLTTFENPGGRFAFTWVTNGNIDNLPAYSGTHTIAAVSPADNSAADDWLISKKLTLGEGATFDFYARNLGTTNSVFIGDNDYHRVTVLVSEDSNTKTSDFKVVMKETEMPYLDGNNYNHYTADLSAYAGKSVYVALRHTTTSANWWALFDDFTFTGVVSETNAISQVPAGIDKQADVTVYSVSGAVVKSGTGAQTLQSLGKGLYIVKVKEGNSVKTYRITRK